MAKIKAKQLKDVTIKMAQNIGDDEVTLIGWDEKKQERFMYSIQAQYDHQEGKSILVIKRYKEVLYELPKTGAAMLFPFPK